MQVRSLAAVLAPCGWLALATACQSISDSVTSPSRWVADSSEAFADSSQASADSSNAASDSVSGSSSPDDDDGAQEESRYRDDVRVTTRSLASAGATDDELLRGLGRVAAQHGVSRWEDQPGTWIALGAGLGEAGLAPGELDALLARLGEPGPGTAQRALVLEGYASSAR